ncbi:anthrone oxygenase family protein [Nonomuraea sp. NPDC001023]|uniref:anthrone oxygenase family protein n=1 Tax=unclassified Nonomuraea TaxID=2593643 RepID=UPI00332B2134
MSVLAAVSSVLALVLNGLMAGVFFAFSTSVMPGLDALGEPVGPEGAAAAMRSMNRKILNPGFLSTFTLAPVASLLAGVFLLIGGDGGPAVLAFAAAVVYFLGSIAVTAAINVPMNNALDAGELAWQAYAPRWTRWNTLRGWASALAVALLGVALYVWV